MNVAWRAWKLTPPIPQESYNFLIEILQLACCDSFVIYPVNNKYDLKHKSNTTFNVVLSR